MTVLEVIKELMKFDPEIKVRFLTYGCGSYSYVDLTPEIFSKQVDDKPEEIVQIQADWN